MAARSKYADTPGVATPPLDHAAAYSAALDALETARRTPDADEPIRSKVDSGDGTGDWYDSIAPSPLAAATAAVNAARLALNDAHGPNAVALQDAAFKLRGIDRRIATAEATGLGVHVGSEFASLLATRHATAILVANLTDSAERDRQRADARAALESQHADLLARLNRDLASVHGRLTGAARDAQTALANLHAEAAAWRESTREARAALVAAGFDADRRFDGCAYPTDLGADLSVSGTLWFALEPVALLARVMWRVASASGERGRTLAGALLRQSGGSALHADALLREVPAPVVPSEPLAGPRMPALRDWAHLPEVTVADKSAYRGPDKPRPRRLGMLRSK